MGIWELLIVLAIVLVIFGGRRLPDIGRSLGDTVREIRKVPDYKARSDSDPPESGDESRSPDGGPSLKDFKDLRQLGTRSGRWRMFGRWLSKGR